MTFFLLFLFAFFQCPRVTFISNFPEDNNSNLNQSVWFVWRTDLTTVLIAKEVGRCHTRGAFQQTCVTNTVGECERGGLKTRWRASVTPPKTTPITKSFCCFLFPKLLDFSDERAAFLWVPVVGRNQVELPTGLPGHRGRRRAANRA